MSSKQLSSFKSKPKKKDKSHKKSRLLEERSRHSKNMRQSEINQHYARASAVDTTIDNFEGGKEQFNDDINDEEGEEELDNDVGIDALTALENFGTGPDKAKKIMVQKIIKGERDFDLTNFELNNLDFMKDQVWKQLTEIYLMNNMVNSIDVLSRFGSLKEIDAQNCHIVDVNLNLKNLEQINLSNNHIVDWPKLPQSSNLKTLILSGNQIESLNFELGSLVYQDQLQTLDLAGNMIEPLGEDDYKLGLIQKLQSFSNLRSLTLENNPFFLEQNLAKFQDYSIRNVKMDVVTKLKQLINLDGVDIGDVIRDMEHKANNIVEESEEEEVVKIDLDQQQIPMNEEAKELQPQDAPAKEIVAVEQKKPPIPKKPKKKQPPPSLRKLLRSLESANGDNKGAMAHLQTLAGDVDNLISQKSEIDGSFGKGIPEEETEEDIQTFMQNCEMLIDNQYEMQGIVLSILAKLSIINYMNFGLSCFNTLKDLMKSGDEMEDAVIKVIQDEVINKMKADDPEEIPVPLFVGLYELIDDTDKSEILSGMFENCFPKWLEAYNNIMERHFAQTGLSYGNNETYDAIVSLLAISVKDEDNIDRFMNQHLVDEVEVIIRQSDWTHNRYIPCLNLVAALSNAKEEAADEFMEKNIEQKLFGNIDSSLKKYKIHNTLFDEGSQETIEQQMLKYQTLSAEIRTLGGLLQSKEEYRLRILDRTNPNTAKDIVSIMGHEQTDPILLTAVCTFAFDLFECEQVRYQEEKMRPFHEAINNMNYMVPYLGFHMYPKLLAMTRKYHDAHNPGIKVTDSGSPRAIGMTQEIGQALDSTIDAAAKEAREQDEIKKSLQHLNDPIVNGLFISIISLTEFICREANTNKSNELFFEISNAMNDNEICEREQALFNCLEIPDDDVKLAVVRCLFAINSEGFEVNEIMQITNVMSNSQNISAGQTELVLSTIYWICTKFVLGDPEEQQSSMIFQTKYGDKTINEAVNILEKNLHRVVYGDDDQEKYALSMSILNFIKASSIAPKMQKYLKGKQQQFKNILFNEDLYSTDEVKQTPIDIENSLIGRDMNVLIECISGVDTIQPYCDVSLRIIMRMADVLMYRHQISVYDIKDDKDPVDELKVHQQKIYRKKKKAELEFWIDKPIRYFEDLDSFDDQAIYELSAQHNCFTQSNGVALLKMFLTSKFPQNEEIMRKLISDSFDETNVEKNENGFQKQIMEKKSVLKQKFEQRYCQDEYAIRRTLLGKKKKQTEEQQQEVLSPEDAQDDEQNTNMNENCARTKVYKYKQSLQFEELGINYYGTLVDDDDGLKKDEIEMQLIQKQVEDSLKNKEGASNIYSLKEKRGDGFLNKPIRCLTIAAYLRCLYAAIEYAPTIELKMGAINNIKDPLMFRSITQLCDSTNWDEESGIGAKYLRVMRHIIKLPLDKDQESTEMLLHYELISIVSQKALSKIVEKMKKDIQLTEKDQICIFEISLAYFTIVQQGSNFVFYQNTHEYANMVHEHTIMIKLKKKTKQSIPNHQKRPYPLKLDEWEPICKRKNVDYGKGEITEKNYHVEIPDIHSKRSVQQKVVEFMILKLFSKQSIFSLIDILFKDMIEDAKIFDEEEEDDDDDDEDEESVKSEKKVDLDASIDAFKLAIDIDEYLEIKGILTIERVKDIVGEIMSATKNFKYDILENIMKGVIFEGKKIRESFMQEILKSAEDAQYKVKIERYINDEFKPVTILPRIDDSNVNYMVRHERVIEFVRCDMNDMMVENNLESPAENQKDHNWVQRIFVLTNQGIQIMKDIPQEKINLCQNDCDDSEFCPRGPYQEFTITFIQMVSIINFPQLPQKIVLIYEQGEEYDQKYQLTLNIPTFTRAAKIYNNVLSIMQQTKYEQDKISKPIGMKKYGPIAYKQNYVDLYVQSDIRFTIQQTNEEEIETKNKCRKQQLIYCSYIQEDGMMQMISDKYFKKWVSRELKTQDVIKKKTKSNSSPFTSHAQEPDLFLNDQILVCITNKYVILLKEQWDKWCLCIDSTNLKQHRYQRELDIQKQIDDEAKLAALQKPKTEGLKDDNPLKAQYEHEDMCDAFKSNLFKIITMIEIEKIETLEVHKGKDPSIELLVKAPTKKGQDQNFFRTKLQFPGDMERQIFVNKLYAFQKGEFDEEEEEEEDAGSDEDSDEQEEADESDNEEVYETIMYD